MKLEVKAATSTQTAIPELGKAEKKLYYLIIGEAAQQVVINVGEKTYKAVQELAMIQVDKSMAESQNEAYKDIRPESKKPTK